MVDIGELIERVNVGLTTVVFKQDPKELISGLNSLKEAYLRSEYAGNPESFVNAKMLMENSDNILVYRLVEDSGKKNHCLLIDLEMSRFNFIEMKNALQAIRKNISSNESLIEYSGEKYYLNEEKNIVGIVLKQD